MPVLRPAVPADADVLVRLARAFYDEDGFATSTAELTRNVAVLLAADNAHIALAEVDGIAAGFALSTTAFILESGLVAELQDLYVVPEARGRGLGSALIEDSLSWARSRAATKLEVVVAPNGRDVSQLLSYYASRRFVDDGRRVISRRTDLPDPDV
jgi:aminoglycoside 6'-N-acetyltransferase I